MSKPYKAQGTKSMFYIPKTLASDFDQFLSNDIPNTVMDFTLLDSWYDQFKEDYEPNIIRGQLYPDATKSRYQDTDNNLNIRTSSSSGTKKGDMLIDQNGVKYLLDWQISPQPNNNSSRAVRCNMYLDIKRYKQAVGDRRGYMIQPAGMSAIVQHLPCNAYRYDGRPEYSAVSGNPGVSPNALTILICQYNEQTKNIKDQDQFIWGDDTYVVIDVNHVGVNIDAERGVLKIQAKKKPGGVVK